MFAFTLKKLVMLIVQEQICIFCITCTQRTITCICIIDMFYYFFHTYEY